jgi:hypothetical protein
VEKAAKQIKAASCHQTISTAENTWFENQKRDLAAQLLKTQMEIGQLNKCLRAGRNSRQPSPLPGPARAPIREELSRSRNNQKSTALRIHREFPAYFLLAAREELVPGLYAQVEARAKEMLSDALRMGLETR